MRRRTLLTLSTATIAALAGCGGDSNGNGNDDDPDSEPEPEPESEPDDGDDEPDTEPDEEPDRSDATELLSIREADDYFDNGGETFEGEGQTVLDDITLGGAFTTWLFEHGGESNFALELEGPTEALLVNDIGAVAGATGLGVAGGEYVVDVTADGAWSLTAAQPLAPAAEIRTPPVEASGEGPDVVGPVEIDATVTVSGTHDGESNFAVQAYDEDASDRLSGELIFNEIGAFEGETRADPTGVVWVVVEADGAWTLDIE